MSLYPEELLRQLREAADISLIIEQFVPLKRSGNGKYLGVCPFHDDKRPSMNVNPQMGIYKCFACGAGGDVFKFVMEYEKMDFRTAVEFVANFINFPLPRLEQNEETEEREILRKINNEAQLWFKEQLKLSEMARAYLEKREISEKTIELFGLGYAPNNGLLEHLHKLKFSLQDVVKAGLAVEKDGKALNKFYDHLMIPICSLSGTVVGFGGRYLGNSEKAPKYMNSPETPLYNKSEVLFGLDKSRRAISKENSVILVEGYFDLIAMFQAGIENVVSISGVALSERQAQNLSRYAKTAFISLDGDSAGQKATDRCIEILLLRSFGIKVVNLVSPTGEKVDPDLLIRHGGAAAFKNLQANAKDWLNYLSEQKPLNSAESRAAFVLKIKTMIASMDNFELRSQYLSLLQEKFATSRSLPTAPQRYTNIRDAVQTEPSQETNDQPEISFSSLPGNEIRLVNLILKTQDIQKFAVDFLDPSLLTSSYLAELLDYGFSVFEEYGKIDLKFLYDKLPPSHREILLRLPDEHWELQNAIREFSSGMLMLLISREKKSLRENRENMECYIKIQQRIKTMESLTQRSEDGENIMNELASLVSG